MKKYFLSVFIVTASLLSCNQSNQTESQNLTREIKFTKQGELRLIRQENDSVVADLKIEIADNDYKTQIGLMYRKSMEDDQAMLFLFPRPEIKTFYMKNTEISLDILYFDAQKKLVHFHENAKPFDPTSIPSRFPAQYVLEVNAGLAKKWGIQNRDRFEFERD